MKTKKYIIPAIAIVLLTCLIFTRLYKNGSTGTTTKNNATNINLIADNKPSGFIETFENGNKNAYQNGDAILPSGMWNLTGALIGHTDNDHKNGTKSVRIQNGGSLTMQFDIQHGATEIVIGNAVYGTDKTCTWGLWYSTNSGNTWSQTSDSVTTTATTISLTHFHINITSDVRFQVRHINGGRLNIDDFSVTDGKHNNEHVTAQRLNTAVPERDDNMALGNPSGATKVVSNSGNYLMVKQQYAMSYNNNKGMANWVSWHLSKAWKGPAKRCNCFMHDDELPDNYFHVNTGNYTGTGFDRGHLCPSDDRDASDADNATTFKMTNMSPQAPNMNQVTWEAFESYCRHLVTDGNELYIIAGGYGSGGSGSHGGITRTIANGKINVPGRFWKIAVILPVGQNDLKRISTNTRVIAIDMPNNQTVSEHPWHYYRTTIDAIEASTGYDFMSNVSTTIQRTIEATPDTETIH